MRLWPSRWLFRAHCMIHHRPCSRDSTSLACPTNLYCPIHISQSTVQETPAVLLVPLVTAADAQVQRRRQLFASNARQESDRGENDGEQEDGCEDQENSLAFQRSSECYSPSDPQNSQHIVPLLTLRAYISARTLASPALACPAFLGRVAHEDTRPVTGTRRARVIARSVRGVTHRVRIGRGGRVAAGWGRQSF